MKSCTLDTISTFLLKELVDMLIYTVPHGNDQRASLREGHLPATQKHAVLTPLLKKPYFDTSDLKNYRPVSNLVFISKVVERIVAHFFSSSATSRKMTTAAVGISAPSLDGDCASAGPVDIYAAADRKDVTLLSLLDLNAAFDCVDHNILARRLQRSFGFRGMALSWL